MVSQQNKVIAPSNVDRYTYGEAVQGNYSGQISTTGWNVNNILDTISFSGQVSNLPYS